MKWENPLQFHHTVTPLAPRATIDFETRSTQDLKRVGAWKYARHSSTQVLCLAFRLPGDSRASLWHAGFMRDLPGGKTQWQPAGMLPGSGRTLEELFDWIRKGGLVEAHNVFFERCIWEHVFTRPPVEDEYGAVDFRFGAGAPKVSDRQWRCSAAKAAAWGLPRDLAGACEALLGRSLKDMEGRKAMLRLCKPRKPRKYEIKDWIYWHEDEASFQVLFAYCARDVDAEHQLSQAVPDLSPFEYKVWLSDMRANW